MFDIGWTELLVIAVVLIVVVGPKDLPPMLRAFGKMTTRARKVAGEFRQQFDEALREAELDDVRQTIADAQKLNPMNTLREAMNPLRDMGNEIKADLQRSTTVDPPKATPVPEVSTSEPMVALGESVPAAETVAAALPVASEPGTKPKAVRKPRATAVAKAPASAVVATPIVAEAPVIPVKPARKPKAALSAPVEVAAVEDKPKRAATRKGPVSIAEPEAAAPKKRATSVKKKDNA